MRYAFSGLGVTLETLTFFWPRFHAPFYNLLKINAPRNKAWPRPDRQENRPKKLAKITK